MGLISNIIDGWDAYLRGEVSESVKRRASVCKDCKYAKVGFYEKFMPDETLKEVQGLKCNKCKCPLSTKLRSEKETCPIGKWE